MNTVNPLLSSHPKKAQKVAVWAGGCLAEVNINTKLKFGNIQVGCLIKMTANSDWPVSCMQRYSDSHNHIVCNSNESLNRTHGYNENMFRITRVC